MFDLKDRQRIENDVLPAVLDDPEYAAAQIVRLEKQIEQIKASHKDYALVPRKPSPLGVATLCQIMDDYLPEQIENEKDMQHLINGLWPRLVCEWEKE